MSTERKEQIIVTGFGPFAGHEIVNASWEAVRLLPDQLTYDGESYELYKMEVPVEYVCVDNAVQTIWTKKPLFVIHCGVNATISHINLEQYAVHDCYRRADYKGNYLPNGGKVCLKTKCKPDNIGILRCKLDLKRIIETIELSIKNNEKYNSITSNGMELPSSLVTVSYDVGSYLCGYIYLKSLDCNAERCLFVHVPPVDKPLSSQQTSIILEEIIKACLKEILHHEQDN